MKTLIVFTPLIISIISQADYRDEVKMLEEKFLVTDFQTMAYKHQELPNDIKHWLAKVTYENSKIANFCEAYNIAGVLKKGLRR